MEITRFEPQLLPWGKQAHRGEGVAPCHAHLQAASGTSREHAGRRWAAEGRSLPHTAKTCHPSRQNTIQVFG